MRERRAFTLLELLVVIGIIAILLALVVPTLASSRQAANRVVCMSNLHQLASAFVMYAMDNRERLPRYAPQGMPSGDEPPMPHDWIHWNWGRDLKQSAIAPYVPGFPASLLVCPSDDPEVRLRDLGKWSTEGKYRFSYTLNFYMSSEGGGVAESRLSRVRRPSEKILLVEEDQSSIDDGCWQPMRGLGMYMNLVAIRHDRSRRSADFNIDMIDMPHPAMKGNVAFCDGHVEYVMREFAHDPVHYLPKEVPPPLPEEEE